MSVNRQLAKPIDPAKRCLLQLGLVATGFYAVLWGLQFIFKDNWLPGTVAVVATTIAGAYIVRPGWNIVPRRIDMRVAVLFGVIPLMSAFAAMEELLYRQVIYRWLERGHLSDHTIILATATAWGCGHLGGVFAQPYTTFSLLQSVYLVWIGVLLGELRRTSGSWLTSCIGHLAYNITVLLVLSLIE